MIMPNHFHGIIIIERARSDRSRPVVVLQPAGSIDKTKSLSQLIGAFKTTSSILIHQAGLGDFAWQRSFYDRIIRTEEEFINISEYIQNNPLKLESDRNKTENAFY